MVAIQNRRIVLVGGGGFIGHHLALRLRRLGAEVSIVDSLHVNNMLAVLGAEVTRSSLHLNFLNQRLALLKKAGIPIHVQDARDYHALSRLLETLKPQTLVHLAAIAHANRSNKDPQSTFDHSLRTLENALDSSKSLDSLEHFVYFSSSMVYGNFKTATVTEEEICEPLGIYGALKFAGEKMVIAYNQVFDLPYTIVRPSALYGERCISGRVGQVFIEQAIRDRELTVSGDGAERVDFTYIDDLTDGLVRVIENERARGETFNLTYGQARETRDLVEILRQHFPDIRVRHATRDKLVPMRGTLSVEKARAILGYNPAFPIELGFTKYIEWYKQMLKGVLSSQNLSSTKTELPGFLPSPDSSRSWLSGVKRVSN